MRVSGWHREGLNFSFQTPCHNNLSLFSNSLIPTYLIAPSQSETKKSVKWSIQSLRTARYKRVSIKYMVTPSRHRSLNSSSHFISHRLARKRIVWYLNWWDKVWSPRRVGRVNWGRESLNVSWLDLVKKAYQWRQRFRASKLGLVKTWLFISSNQRSKKRCPIFWWFFEALIDALCANLLAITKRFGFLLTNALDWLMTWVYDLPTDHWLAVTASPCLQFQSLISPAVCRSFRCPECS